MRKFIPLILIVTILASFLAPLGVEVNERNIPKVKSSVVQADDGGIKVGITPIVTSNSIVYELDLSFEAVEPNFLGLLGTREGLMVTIKDSSGKEIDSVKKSNSDLNVSSGTSKLSNYRVVVAKNLSPGSAYTIDLRVRQIVNLRTDGSSIRYNENLYFWQENTEENNHTVFEVTDSRTITTLKIGETEQVLTSSTVKNEQWSDLPVCTSSPNTWFKGCLVRLFYYALFIPTSYLFALAGTFFDTTFGLSVQDSSYRSEFVLQGWGIMRDFCNMFFIFVMLYIAFSTILNINGSKTKEMIINVVIVGLLINFSLFFTQVIVDTSNILARVFYTSDAISIEKKDHGNASNLIGNANENEEKGIIPLSEALVNKVDPQSLILNASKVGKIPDKGGAADTSITGAEGTPGVGTWIIVILLAVGINIVGFIVFLSVGIIFITRIVGLWLAMIFAPLAFFSYTVPELGNMEVFGHKHWWPETLKLAFLAPVFIFFLYLILAFLEKGLNIMDARQEDGLMFVISIVLPFAVIMVLLWKAKDIAKSFSGKLGQSITNGITAMGGLALGGAALGAAALGRGTIGAVAKYTQNDATRQKDSFKSFGNYKDWSLGKKINPFSYIKQAGKSTMAGVASGIHGIKINTTDASGSKVKKSLGLIAQEKDKAFGKKTGSQSTLDYYTDKTPGFSGKKWKDLSESEQLEVRKKIDKDKLAMQEYGSNLEGVKDDDKRKFVNDHIEEVYRDYENADKSDPTKRTAAENKLKADTLIDKDKGSSDIIKNAVNPSGAMGEFMQALRKGSYDIRNISNSTFSTKGIAKFGVGLAAILASGVRAGLKGGVGVDYGTGQREFLKDLSGLISGTLKSMKIDVKIDDSGKVKSSGGGH